jgi:shikimate dehydrogenase
MPPSPLSGRTTVVGIIGDPVAHSASPAMHNAAFAALGLDWVYVPFAVRAAAVRDAVRAVRALGLAGVNVTVPHKEAVLAHLDAVSALAERVGAVNTIVNRDGTLSGDNTDVAGFMRALRGVAGRLAGRRAVVIGAGGSARAVLAGLGALRVRQIVVANRTAARARGLARRFAGMVDVEVSGLAALVDAALLRDAALIVNATSIGLGDAAFPALAWARTPPGCVAFDLVYGRDTAFLAGARRAQRRTLDGAEMLLHQGAAAFALWTGRRPPLAVMRAALHRAMAARQRKS